MYISELFIMNYRSIEKEKISFKPGKNVLVGKNNSGKSNIVKALDLVIGEKSPVYQNINEKDFFAYSNNTEVKIKDAFFISVKLDGHDVNENLFKSIKGLWLSPIGKDNLLKDF